MLWACCLEQDIAQLVDGDLTEIGEKGITIRKTISNASRLDICHTPPYTPYPFPPCHAMTLMVTEWQLMKTGNRL